MGLIEAQRFMKASRVMAGLTQEEVAEKLGVARNTIVYYENNPWSISLEKFVLLKELYGQKFADDFFNQKIYKKYN